MIRRPAGFTMAELMITIAVLGILITIAAPSVRDLTRNARMTGQVNDLMTDLAVARSEAAKRGVHTAVCASQTGTSCDTLAWNRGWIVFVDPNGDGALGAAADIVKVSPAIDGSNETVPNTIIATGLAGNWIGFRPSGLAKLGAGIQTATFDICDARNTAAVGAPAASNKGRRISVSTMGRAITARCTCPDLTICNP